MESQTACWWGPLEARVGCPHVPALHVGWCHRSCTHPEPGLRPQLPCSETTQQQQQRVEGICCMPHASLMDNSQHATGLQAKTSPFQASDKERSWQRCPPWVCELDEGKGRRARWYLDVNGVDVTKLRYREQLLVLARTSKGKSGKTFQNSKRATPCQTDPAAPAP